MDDLYSGYFGDNQAMDCVDCHKKPATTKDGTNLCLGCLRKRIINENPIVEIFSDCRGRPARSSRTLGGSAELGSDGDMGWETDYDE